MISSRNILIRQSSKDIPGDSAFAPVESSNVMQHLHSFIVSASIEQEFGGLLETEDNESKEENDEGNGAKGK